MHIQDKKWHGVLDKIRKTCVGPDDVLKVCPDDPGEYGIHRLLYVHQDGLLLLLTAPMLHEYKGAHDCSDHISYKRMQTRGRANYLAEQGFDVRPAAGCFLRNGITHSP